VTTLAWLHVGDLHADPADDWIGVERLKEIVAQANDHLEDLDFLYLPGDNANTGTAEEYAAILAALAPLRLPWRTVPGDHDFHGRTLASYDDAIPPQCRPRVETISGHRCLFLDIVSAGTGGPDFVLDDDARRWIGEELTAARINGEIPLVFMHAYPDDLRGDGEAIGRLFAEGDVRFVDTGHTHYNEILNDGHVVYGATRSTAQIEEDDSVPGYSIVCFHDGVPSWRFRPLDAPWPALQIVSPADLSLMTDPADPRQVARPGKVSVTVRSFGTVTDPVMLSVDGGTGIVMTPGERGFWRAVATIAAAGLHRVAVGSGDVADAIDLLMRAEDELPKRRRLVAPGSSCHAIGAWPEAGLLGTRLGPNANGGSW